MATKEEIEIPLGAKDSELCGWEYTIPEGMEATIVDNKIVVKKKKSEDEQHRKWILEYLYDGLRKSDVQFFDRFKSAIAWFEKQGEHANFLNKIQIGDKVTRNKDGMLVNLSQLDRVAKKDEQKPADEVEPKFHEGDIIIHKELGGNYIHFSHKIIQVDILDKKYRLEGGLVAHFSEQDDYELVEQKPAWSEEDEELLHDLSDTYFYNDEDYPEETYKQMLKRVLDWMNKRAKSLRPQNHWKPSEEQMEALDDFIYAKYPNTEKHGAAVKSLYQDLKKLMEE